jgi:hypothetical protein
LLAGLSKRVDLKLVSRLEFGSGRWRAREIPLLPSKIMARLTRLPDAGESLEAPDTHRHALVVWIERRASGAFRLPIKVLEFYRMRKGVDHFLRALVVAVAAHAALIAPLLRSISGQGEPAVHTEPIELEVVMEIASVDTLRDESPTDKAGPGVTTSEVAVATRRHSTRLQHATASRTGAPTTATDAVPSGAGVEAGAAAPSLSLDQLGLDGPNRLAFRPATDESSSSAERLGQSMRQLAQEHDRTVGLGAGGPVAAALQKATYRSTVPLDGRATFEVVVIGTYLSSITLVPASSETDRVWNEVAKAAFADLAGRHIRIPEGSRGVVLHIQVISRAPLPSGHDPGLEISVGPIVVHRGKGKRSARLSILGSAPMLSSSAIDFPGTSARLPAPGSTMGLISTDIDPVDLGAHDRQVVHTHTLDESPL